MGEDSTGVGRRVQGASVSGAAIDKFLSPLVTETTAVHVYSGGLPVLYFNFVIAGGNSIISFCIKYLEVRGHQNCCPNAVSLGGQPLGGH